MGRLTGKVCLVTGAARGIGAGIAEAFAAEGAQVLVTDYDLDAAEAQAARFGATARRLDVADEAAWTALEGDVPTLDVVVNNAGITGFERGLVAHDPEHASLSAWRAVHRVNLDGTFLGCRYAIRAMRPRGAGSIINLASRAARIGVPGAAAYAASKAAICSLTKSVALHCAQDGLAIRCNAVLPGAILTPMWDALLGDGPEREAQMRAAVADTPLRRFGTVTEVAAVAVFLASDEAAYMTGADFEIDGGLSAGPLSANDSRER